jgi:hypothetical protein
MGDRHGVAHPAGENVDIRPVLIILSVWRDDRG